MKKQIYWKDIRQSFSTSKGRVFSIFSLMALGSFTLVGLKVTGPDIQRTGQDFFKEHHTADLAVLSDYGLDASDQEKLNTLDSKATVEYGYFRDVVVEDSDEAVRLYSSPETLSTYALVDGRMPEKEGEITLASFYQDQYQIGDTITFTEKETLEGKLLLKEHSFKIVGFANSSEILSKVNLGASTAGSGSLKGYGVIVPSSFDSDVYMVARVAYDDLYGKNPYSQSYIDQVYEDKKEVEKLIDGQADSRLISLKATANSAIQDGENQLTQAKNQLADAQNQLLQGQEQIVSGESQLSQAKSQLASSSQTLQDASSQLAQGRATLDASQTQLASAAQQLEAGRSQLVQGQTELAQAQSAIAVAESTLSEKGSQLEEARVQLEVAKQTLAGKESELASAKTLLDQKETELSQTWTQLESQSQVLTSGEAQLEASKSALAEQIAALTAQGIDPSSQEQIVAAQAAISQKEAELAAAQTSLAEARSQLQAGQSELESKKAEYQSSLSQLQAAQSQLASQEATYQAGLAAYQDGLSQLESKKAQVASGQAQLDANSQVLASKEAEYQSGLAQYQSGEVTYASKWSQYQSGLAQLAEAQATISEKETELTQAKETLAEKTTLFQTEKAKADKEMEQGESDLQTAKEKAEQIDLPTYQVYSRREIPGSDGYISYENNATIIDAVGNIFPVVLYFVAALVTFTTMARFVDEERLKAGTLKALGYDRSDIMKKFLLYGLTTGLTGTLVGVVAGHLLLPYIIYTTYSKNILVAPIEFHFYPGMTLLAILLALASAVLPAYLAARKELAEKPAQLLLPKPPSSGSKIFLERITPLWSRMSFTQKVTARNIFRYKQRMLMTIFGVSGSVALLFGGLGMRSSIADLNNRQFVDIIKYDMIVAENTHLTSQEERDLQDLLDSSEVKEEMSLHYETLTKVAGSKNDQQSITTLVFDDPAQDQIQEYIHLVHRGNQEDLILDSNGVILSEKLADLLGVQVGDSFTVQNANNEEVTLKVSGIAEMYMGHFIFMNQSYYQEAFGKEATDNAHLINLKDDSTSNTEKVASRFMDLAGVKGVVQNTSLKAQVTAIVDSLNRVMYIMIIVSVLLAVVILYNLTNINVAERIRELSTIKVLGFYNKEVTMYIYRESIYLSLLGILVGFGMGILLHRYMLLIIPPDSVMFNPALSWTIYAAPAGVVILILAILGYVVNTWLKKVDMLEALKSIE